MGLSLLRDPLRIALSLSIQGWVSTLLKDPWRIPLSEYSRMGPLLRDPAARSAVTKNKQLQNG